MSTQEPQNHSNDCNVQWTANGAISYISGLTTDSIATEKNSKKRSFANKENPAVIVTKSVSANTNSNCDLSRSSLGTKKIAPNNDDADIANGTTSKPASKKQLSEKTPWEKVSSEKSLSQQAMSKSPHPSVVDVREELMLLISELEELIEYNE